MPDRNFLIRLASALVLLTILAVVITVGGQALPLFLTVVASLMLWEWGGVIGLKRRWQVALPVFFLALALTLSTEQLVLALAGGLLVVASVAFIYGQRAILFLADEEDEQEANMALDKSQPSWLWPCVGFALVASQFYSAVWIIERYGVYFILPVLVLVWVTDTMAYVIGRLFGKRKLAPKLSPNKTWAGFVGGIIGALVVAAGVYSYFAFIVQTPFLWRSPENVTLLALFVVLCAVLAQAGDLLESAFKRTFSCKDSGTLIPGHGGVLDRLDSLWLVLPCYALTVWWVVP